jgi:hypothetical protein
MKSSGFVLMVMATLSFLACGGTMTTPPPPATYTIGGAISGLSGAGLVLQNNGGNNLSVTANGAFTFTKAIASAGAYKVTVLTQPSAPAQTCVVTNGSGTANANVTTVQVACSTISTANEWTWVGGSNFGDARAAYGTLGTPASTNDPGARFGAVYWSDTSGNFWLFGGFDNYAEISFNDLWEYSKGQWTWMGGSNQPNQPGSYGTEGTASASNIPGARYYAAFATDAAANLWLFGGSDMNDLWKYSAGQWTWVSGSDLPNQAGTYGTLGTAAPGNVPGAREGAAAWIDASGNFWLFGGQSENSSCESGNSNACLNDLWKYSAGEWTWMAGSDSTNQPGTYGTQGVASANSTPGARYWCVRWTDSSGNLWLFGGYGYDSTGTFGSLNDLWKYSTRTNEWTWMSGSNVANQPGIFGTQGVSAPGNVPGARYGAVGWIDSSGNFWLTSGLVYDTTKPGVLVYDLWEYTVSSGQWTYVNGARAFSLYGNYGTQGVAAPSNYPGSRQWPSAWIDTSGNFWLFGGSGYASAGSPFDLNDVWMYQP